jgi:hypothetical protein
MTRQIARLKFTTKRLQIIEMSAVRLRLYCPVCEREVEMLTRTQAAGALEVNLESIARLIHEGQLHAAHLVSGAIRICKDSLLAR